MKIKLKKSRKSDWETREKTTYHYQDEIGYISIAPPDSKMIIRE